MAEAIRVEGLPELDRAFGKISKDLRKGVRSAERMVAEPVRARAEGLAIEGISNIGGQWSRMRIGVTASNVYVAPKARNRGGSPRPNLGGELLEAMNTALDDSREQVVAGFELMLDRLVSGAGF
jgi:hypothetical protein